MSDALSQWSVERIVNAAHSQCSGIEKRID